MPSKEFSGWFKTDQIFSFRNSSGKRKYKDQKFGYGGKKSGMKWNTKDSYNDVSSFRAKVAHNKGNKGGKKGKGGKQNVGHRLTHHSLFTCTCEVQIWWKRSWYPFPPFFRNAPESLFAGRWRLARNSRKRTTGRPCCWPFLPFHLQTHQESQARTGTLPRQLLVQILSAVWLWIDVEGPGGRGGPAGLLRKLFGGRNQSGKGCSEKELTLKSSPDHHFL